MKVTYSHRTLFSTVCRWFLFSCALSVVVCLQPLPATAQSDEVRIPGQLTQLDAGQVRSPADIAKGAATLAPAKKVRIPFLPTFDPSSYAQWKAASKAPQQRSGRAVGAPSSGPLSPPMDTGNGWDSTNQTGACCYPPDTIAAEGAGQVVTVTNDVVAVYDTSGNPLANSTLGALMGTPEFIFDPQVRFDGAWNRFVIMATRQAASSTDTNTHFWLAISSTSDATGGFIVYQFPLGEAAGNWCDFDKLGMDQDAALFTCNIFHLNPTGSNTFQHAWVGAIAKARVYNGLGGFFQFFKPVAGNIAPPTVSPDGLSQANGSTYLLSAQPTGSTLIEYKLTNSSRPFGITFTMMSTASVGAYTFPPNASQPGTTAVLDTLDARFVDDIYQVGVGGTSLFAAHSINLGGAFGRFYEINAETGGVVQEGTFGASATSSDFNVSIATNPNKDVFVNWSSVDATNNVLANMRISGRCHGDAPGVISSPGTDVADSASFYGLFRFGDYSSVSVDSSDGTAWVYNETFFDPTTWNTHVSQIAFPSVCQ